MSLSRRGANGSRRSASAFGTSIALSMIALTLLSLTACSVRSVAVMDSRLTAPCDRPTLQGNTNRDVWRLAIEQDEALTDCADRIDAIRELTR